MNLLLLALLLADTPNPPPRTVTLYDDHVMVGPAKIRTLDIPMLIEPARIVCSYEVTQGGSGVRLVMLRSEDAQRWLRGEAHDVIASTSFARQGAFSHRPADPDHYVIVLDNRMEGRTPAEVHLLVRVIYGDETPNTVTYADPRKGKILVWSSLLLFAGIAVFAAVRFRSAANED
jgi:hypothetical protein